MKLETKISGDQWRFREVRSVHSALAAAFFWALGLSACGVGEGPIGPQSGAADGGAAKGPDGARPPSGPGGDTSGQNPPGPNPPGPNPPGPGPDGGGSGSEGSGTDAGTPGGGGGGATVGNPFAGASFYVNPVYAAKVDTSMARAPEQAPALASLKRTPTAVWLDRIAMVPSIPMHLDHALAQERAENRPVVTTFVIYDLPNRDCAALASNGELSLDADGANRYRTEFIDAIAAEFARRPTQRIVALVEPDSLANIATNLAVPKCAASERAYRDLVAYAVAKLSMPHVSVYLDAAHSGWLGWPDNQVKAARIFSEVLTVAGGADKIRGFVTNLANYTVLKEGVEQYDYQGNPCRDERTYAAQLGAALQAAGVRGKSFVIDTSRNGRGGIRSAWGSWCNIRGAGLGERPKADPAPGIDAYLWAKPPGESDGTTNMSSPRFDASCVGPDSTLGAPEAGEWFHEYLLELVRNASPTL